MYYLSRYSGSGTRQSPFVPVAFSLDPKCGWVDLRPDCTAVAGAALVRSDLVINDARVVLVADANDELVSANNIAKFYTAVLAPQRTPASSKFGDIVADLLMNPPAGFNYKFMPSRGVNEIWLAGQLFWADAVPLLPLGGTITDSFNRANESPIAAPWTNAGGTGAFNLSGNLVVHSVDGDNYLYYNNAGGWNADQTSQWKTIGPAAPDSGPAVHISSAGGINGVFYDGLGEIGKHVNGAFSTVSGGSGTTSSLATNDTGKITITGSTIRAFKNGVETTNSPWTLVGGPTTGSVGLFAFGSTASSEAWDDFVGTGEVVTSANTGLPDDRRYYTKPFGAGGIRE